MICDLDGQCPSEFDYVPTELLSERALMRVTVQFDIDATKFFDIDDIEAACARMLHGAAGRIIKDGLPEPDGLGFEIRLSTPEEEIRGALTTMFAETAESGDLSYLNGLKLKQFSLPPLFRDGHLYGFRSQQSLDSGHGYSVYETPDGKRVIVTCVDRSPEIPSGYYKWEDTVAVGEVVKCVETVRSKFATS